MLTWLGDMKEIFENLLERKFPGRKGEFYHAINLTIDTLSKTPIILLQLENQVYFKVYLDSLLKKNTYESGSQV